MSFQKIVFQYTPPETIPSPPKSSPTQTTSVIKTLSPKAKETRAGQLIQKLDGLRQTAQYLEELLLARVSQLTIPVNYKVNPEVAQAFVRLYQEPEPPNLFTVQMYDNLLEAESGMVRTDIAIDQAGDQQSTVHPVQRADVLTLTGHFENSLSESTDFDPQLALLLRELKGDRIIFDHMIDSLREYPAVRDSDTPPIPDLFTDDDKYFASEPDPNLPTPEEPAPVYDSEIEVPVDPNTGKFLIDPTNLVLPSVQNEPEDTPPDAGDVDLTVYTEVEKRLSLWEQYYAATYNLSYQVDGAYFQMIRYYDQYVTQPIKNLLYIIGLMRSLVLLFHKPKLKNIAKAAFSAFIIPRMVSEVARFTFLVDRLVSKMANPALSVLNSFYRMASGIQRLGNDIAFLLDGGLTGMIKAQATGKTADKSGKPYVPDQKNLKELALIPQILGKTVGYVRWSLRELTNQHLKVQRRLYKLIDRRLGKNGDRLEALQSIRELATVTRILNRIILEQKMGATNGSSNAVTRGIETVTRAAQQSTEQTISWTVQGNTVRATQSALPVATPEVQARLMQNGAAQPDPNTPQEQLIQP